MLYCFCSALFDLEIRGVLNRFAWSQEREKKSKLQQTFSTPLFFFGKARHDLREKKKKNDKLHLNDVRLAFTWALALLHTQCNIRCTHSCDSWSHKFFSFFFSGQKGAWSTFLSALSILWHFPLCFSSMWSFKRGGKPVFNTYSTLSRVGKETKMLWKL